MLAEQDVTKMRKSLISRNIHLPLEAYHGMEVGIGIWSFIWDIPSFIGVFFETIQSFTSHYLNLQYHYTAVMQNMEKIHGTLDGWYILD